MCTRSSQISFMPPASVLTHKCNQAEICMNGYTTNGMKHSLKNVVNVLNINNTGLIIYPRGQCGHGKRCHKPFRIHKLMVSGEIGGQQTGQEGWRTNVTNLRRDSLARSDPTAYRCSGDSTWADGKSSC